jgi:Kef-type K+ transport system membrane component KefB/mannitol/fructose-specific phosphotransferase system IIA component (Ntr-type)
MPVSDPILIFTILISVILAAPLLAERLRVPDLVLLLLAGVVLGPHGTGLLAHSSAIVLFGTVGLIYIMFLAGLEIDLHRFATIRKQSITFGLLTFVFPQGLGALVGYYVLSLNWPASILLASMFASHTLLAYPIASRLGIARNEAVAVTVGATIINTTLALLVLAVIADSTKGTSIDLWFWLGIIFGMTAICTLAWWGIPLMARWFFSNVPEKGGAQFLFVLASVCGCAYLSYYAKMEPIIGAFLAGAAFNRLIPRQSALMNRVEFVGNALFIPFFLISVGMLVDPGALARDPNSWLVAGSMVFTVIATKWLAAKVAEAWFGYNRDEGHVMFGLSVVQAASTLAAVVVGYELKIFDASVLNGAIAMIFVTCPLGAWMVDRYGRRLASQTTDRIIQPGLDQRIMVAVANFSSATRLLDLAFLLRNPGVQGGIHPITIVRDEAETSEAVRKGENLLARCLSHASAADITIIPSVRVGINVSDGIIRGAKELRAETVMVGWGEERTASSRIFGTVLDKLLEACPSKLVLCRLIQPLNTTRRILVPFPPLFDRRSDAILIIRDIKRLAKSIGAELHLFMGDPETEQQLRNMLDQAPPSVPTRIEVAEDWIRARFRLFGGILPDDMAILPLERRKSPLWSPSMDRLFEIMADRFPDINLLAVYPALFTDDKLSLPVLDKTAIAIISCGDLSEATGVKDALRRMIHEMISWTPKQQESIWSLLKTSAETYPVEIAPGKILLHAHSDAVKNTTILIGAGDWSWTLPGCAEPARLILALVSPRDQSPERHLKILSNMARCLHDSAVLEQPYSLSITADVSAVLHKGLAAEKEDASA